MRPNRNLDGYQFTVRPLSKEEGGGYLVEYPDIPGCMSDGETVEEAIANGREALRDGGRCSRNPVGRCQSRVLKRRSGGNVCRAHFTPS